MGIYPKAAPIAAESNITANAEPSADLKLIKCANPSCVEPGDTVAYTLILKNMGPDTAVAAQITDNSFTHLLNLMYTVNGVQQGAWTGSHQVGDMEPDDSVIVVITGIVDEDFPFSMQNIACASSETFDPDMSNNCDHAWLFYNVEADLSITKTVFPSSVGHGGTLKYTIEIHNAGPETAVDIVLEDILPEWLTNTTYTVNAGDSTEWPKRNRVRLGDLNVGETITVEITGTVNPLAPFGPLYNEATVTAATCDFDMSDNIASVTVDIEEQADLSITKTGPEYVILYDTMAFDLVVTNHGPDAAHNVVVLDTPTHFNWATFYEIDGVPMGPWTGGANLGTLNVGQSVTVTISFNVSIMGISPQVYVNNASVRSDTPDPNTNNNNDSHTTVIYGSTEADLSIITRGPAWIFPGSTAVYTLTITNHGPTHSGSVEVADNDIWSRYVTNYAIDGVPMGILRGPIYLSSLNVGQSVVITLSAEIPDSEPPGSFYNIATVRASARDPYTDNNTDRHTAEILDPEDGADVAITKTASETAVKPGDMLTYTLHIINNGPADADDILITDALPVGIFNPTFTADGIPMGSWTGSYMLKTLTIAGTATIKITGRVAGGASGILDNKADAESSTPDPIMSNNSDTVQVEFIYNSAVVTVSGIKIAVGAQPPCGRFIFGLYNAAGELVSTATNEKVF
jgi:uncharacterized repeat protein (TIGR01451 family)